MDDGIVEITETTQESTQVKGQVSSSPEEMTADDHTHGEEAVSREPDSCEPDSCEPNNETKKPRKKMIKQDDESEHRLREWFMCNDAAFKRAMLAARKAGLESFWIGVVKDYTPIPPSYRRYDLAPSLTVSQSVAGECADMGRSY